MRVLHRLAKRAFDLVGAGVGLAATAPVLAIAAAATRMELGPPPLERHLRAGRRGAPFAMWQLRTHPQTELGAILRGTGLAQLPALWNVVRGEMSLVGPRPVHPQYAAIAPRRLEVKPGLTGWSQLHASLTRSWADEQSLDDWYVAHRALTLDVLILVRTVIDGVRRRGGVAERHDRGATRATRATSTVVMN